ncbi:Mitochondrial transcription factor 1 [Fusarium oxysporum f. sp. rapae]|uniref:Mitochondrial transcription factor 1 n=1 Tax=Fusarium oxysporum f. sp. rapae TaxID=485398 RepID=A0A8J5TQY8_FUSOX|nr:Mitochondrial transcription factor 1 [Fusarium oxysporum f. sp. rapae]
MFIAFKNARSSLPRRIRPSPSLIRHASSKITNEQLEPSNELSERLRDTGLWQWTRVAGRPKAPIGDKHRANLVSQSLCDDIAQYIGPSFDRHKGCDIVDINPGPGLWSRTLHDLVQPRKHILMEPDIELYRPFLGDFLDKPNVEAVPKAGILWKDLNSILESLPHQTIRDPAAEPERNDTLLVNVNLCYCPPKKYQSFECVSTMVLYQLMSSIRTASLFQQYGLVRMLVWISDDGKRRLLPRSAIRRKRSAFEAELSLEWLHEICGHDVEVEDRYELRDEWINMESGYNCLKRMKQAGLTMPKGRETIVYNNLSANQKLANKKLAGFQPPRHNRPFREELEGLETAFAEDEASEASYRLKMLRYREKYDAVDSQLFLELLQQRDALMKLWKKSPTQLPAAEAEFNARLDGVKKNTRKEWLMVRDNYHLFRQKKPTLFWDRRPFEPLAARADEFYPRMPCALLDLQPKAMSKYTRQHGPTSRNGTISDTMLRYWFQHMLAPIQSAMDGAWPGFGDCAADIASLHDPKLGGSPLSGHGALVARCVTEDQWADIIKAYLEWPFAPEYTTLVGRLMDDYDVDPPQEDESKGTAMGGVA